MWGKWENLKSFFLGVKSKYLHKQIELICPYCVLLQSSQMIFLVLSPKITIKRWLHAPLPFSFFAVELTEQKIFPLLSKRRNRFNLTPYFLKSYSLCSLFLMHTGNSQLGYLLEISLLQNLFLDYVAMTTYLVICALTCAISLSEGPEFNV